MPMPLPGGRGTDGTVARTARRLCSGFRLDGLLDGARGSDRSAHSMAIGVQFSAVIIKQELGQLKQL